MKNIQTIIQLSKNPHYKLTEEEIQALQRWQESQGDSESGENRKNKKSFRKQTGNFKKHETTVKE